MTITHNLSETNFRDIGCKWLSDNEVNDHTIANDFTTEEYNGYGYGEYVFNSEELLAAIDRKSGRLLIQGIFSFHEENVTMFKRICIIITESYGSHDKWEFNGATIGVNDGTIRDIIIDKPYSEEDVYSKLEKFGYDYCNDWCDHRGHLGLNEWRERYEEAIENEETDLSFVEWFKDAELMDVDQLPEPEFPGLHWTYSGFLDWDSMVSAVYDGTEKWREEQLKMLGKDA